MNILEFVMRVFISSIDPVTSPHGYVLMEYSCNLPLQRLKVFQIYQQINISGFMFSKILESSTIPKPVDFAIVISCFCLLKTLFILKPSLIICLSILLNLSIKVEAPKLIVALVFTFFISISKF